MEVIRSSLVCVHAQTMDEITTIMIEKSIENGMVSITMHYRLSILFLDLHLVYF